MNEDAIDLEPEKEVEEKRLLESVDRDDELKQLGSLLQHEEARDVFWRILSRCGVYQSTYSKNFGDMALAEGRRQIGLWLLSEICEADPTAEMKMRQRALKFEHEEKVQEHRRRQSRRG